MAGSSMRAARGNQVTQSSRSARARAHASTAWRTGPPSRTSTTGMETSSALLMGRDAYDSSKAGATSASWGGRPATGCRGAGGVDHWTLPRHSLHSSKAPAMVSGGRGYVVKLAGRVLSILALAALATPVQGEDDFPLVGTYTENQACKTDGSDPGVSRVKITPRDIDSVFGLCTILNKKREGATFVVHVECKGPGGSQ